MSLAGPVRDKHRFDEAALVRWLATALPQFQGPVEVRQFDAGQSNPTFLLRTAGGNCVLRKQPPGKLVPGAHALDREYRVLRALADSEVPIPAPLAYCADASVIGTPFYVMAWCPGSVTQDPLLPALEPAQRAAIYDSMNRALAALHTVDWRAVGLEGFGQPDKYVQRQIARWGKQNDALGQDDVGALAPLRAWLEANVPAEDESCITHGDYRIGNLICSAEPPAVVAVLDWELATLGHPLADLAYNCMTYHLPAGHPVSKGFIGTTLAEWGIPTEQDYVADYARRCGRAEIPHWSFFKAFSLYRIASIQRGVYARAVAGNASSTTAHLFGESWRMVAEAGWSLSRSG